MSTSFFNWNNWNWNCVESYRISSEVSMPSLSKKEVAFFVILWIVQKKVVPLQIVMNEHKIINDPVFGFIKIRRGLLYDIVQHPLFQRLNRIVQLGLASVVYPGARHTRFQHSLGALQSTSLIRRPRRYKPPS